MKKLFILLTIILYTVTNSYSQTVLRVHLANNSRITLAVNGRYFDKQGTSITVGDLPPGNHNLRIYQQAFDRWGRRYDKKIYQGTVTTEQGIITNFLYDPFGQKVTIRRQYTNDDEENYIQPSSPSSNLRDDDISGRNASANSTDGEETESNDNYVPDTKSPVATPVAAGSFTFAESQKLKSKVDNKKTDTEKLKTIKNALKKETVSTFQIGEMMDWLLFESTRVELAKWVYSHTADKDYFSNLLSKLSYQSSKDEINLFLKNNK